MTGEEVRTLKGHTNSVDGVTFSPDGSTIAGVNRDGTVRFLDAMTGEEVWALKGYSLRDVIWSIAFSPDGFTIASGSFSGSVWCVDSVVGYPHWRTLANP